jgi:hypothetical protein
MILPTKHITPQRSLLGVGALILKHLRGAQTITRLWESVLVYPEVATFERFVLALDLLYSIGVVEIKDGLLQKT